MMVWVVRRRGGCYLIELLLNHSTVLLDEGNPLLVTLDGLTALHGLEDAPRGTAGTDLIIIIIIIIEYEAMFINELVRYLVIPTWFL